MQEEKHPLEQEPNSEPKIPQPSEVVHYPETSPETVPSPSAMPEGLPEPETNKDQAEHPSRLAHLKAWYLSHKKISIPTSILVLCLILAAIPISRYTLSGLVVKKDLIVFVKDSMTDTPVSAAEVKVGSQKVLTDANGKATLLKLKPGSKIILISKKYYKDQTINSTLPVIKSDIKENISLAATGRQVSINVFDYVNGKALSGASIAVAGTSSKTDKEGKATVVVPVGSPTQKATLSLDGYNKKETDLKVGDKTVELNEVVLTPSGKVYFFSKRSGKLEVLKSNLDGGGVTTVLPATGFEQTFNSSISQSPDWKYIALILRRSADDATPQLYILSSEDDRLITVDSGKANFTLQGWAGENLIYTSSRTDLADWQVGKNKLKSYNAKSGKITQLDQTVGVNTPEETASEYYTFQMVSGATVLYAKNWTMNTTIKSHSNTLHSINADGQNHKQIASYETNNTQPPISYAQHSANSVYIWQQEYNSAGTFYEYILGSANPKKIEIDSNDFYVGTQGYYPSPSGKQMLWTEMRDGKNALLIGDQNGGNPTSIGNFAEYLPFGWYSDKYVILSKSNNELYIMSASAGAKPLKITDYQYTNYYY